MAESQIEAKLRQLSTWTLISLATVVLFVIFGSSVLVWQAYRVGGQESELRAVAQETHAGLCALKGDVAQRRVRLQVFLNLNPSGIPGLPAEVLQRSLNDYDSTLAALNVISCP